MLGTRALVQRIGQRHAIGQVLRVDQYRRSLCVHRCVAPLCGCLRVYVTTLASSGSFRDIGDRKLVRVTPRTYDHGMATGTGEGDSPLISTPVAARVFGISPRTLQRYVRAGLIEPEVTLASGQYRWNLDRLRDQMRNLTRPTTE